MSSVDFIDDLKVSRKDMLQHARGPALQCLREKGVVGVSEGLGADVPGLIPAQLLQVHEDAHEFGDRHGRVSIVKLDSSLERGRRYNRQEKN